MALQLLEVQQDKCLRLCIAVGNPHALGAQPLSFTRQVLSLCINPQLLNDPNVTKSYPKDAVERAKTLLKAFKGGMGAYTDSRGNPHVREEVARFISERDGVKASAEVGPKTAGSTLLARGSDPGQQTHTHHSWSDMLSSSRCTCKVFEASVCWPCNTCRTFSLRMVPASLFASASMPLYEQSVMQCWYLCPSTLYTLPPSSCTVSRRCWQAAAALAVASLLHRTLVPEVHEGIQACEGAIRPCTVAPFLLPMLPTP